MRVSVGYTQIELGGQRKNVSRFFCDEKDSNISRRCFGRLTPRNGFRRRLTHGRRSTAKCAGREKILTDRCRHLAERHTSSLLSGAEWRSFCRLLSKLAFAFTISNSKIDPILINTPSIKGKLEAYDTSRTECGVKLSRGVCFIAASQFNNWVFLIVLISLCCAYGAYRCRINCLFVTEPTCGMCPCILTMSEVSGIKFTAK